MTVSPPPTDTDRLAETAWGVLVAAADRELVPLHGANSWNVVAHAVAAALAPVVEQIATRHAAEELQQLIAEADRVAAFGVPLWHLRNVAAALVAAHPDHTDNREKD